MSWFGGLFGSSNVISKMLDIVDDAFFTDEEKAEQKKQILKSYEPYRVAQRLIAIMFCFTFLLVFVLLIAVSFFTDVSHQITVIQDYMSSDFTRPVSIILGFYFAGGALNGVIEKVKK